MVLADPVTEATVSPQGRIQYRNRLVACSPMLEFVSRSPNDNDVQVPRTVYPVNSNEFNIGGR